MKTIKLPYKTTENLEPILRQYSSVVRYAYNRFYEGMEKKEVIHSVKKRKSVKSEAPPIAFGVGG